MADYFTGTAAGHIATPIEWHGKGNDKFVSFSIAVNNLPVRDNNGKLIGMDPTYMEVIVHAAMATALKEANLPLGAPITVTGKIIQASWKKDGRTYRKHKLYASTIFPIISQEDLEITQPISVDNEEPLL